jgi:hypothetical protein
MEAPVSDTTANSTLTGNCGGLADARCGVWLTRPVVRTTEDYLAERAAAEAADKPDKIS